MHTHSAAKTKGPKTDGKTADQYLAFGKLAYDAHQYGALGYLLKYLFIHKSHKIAI